MEGPFYKSLGFSEEPVDSCDDYEDSDCESLESRESTFEGNMDVYGKYLKKLVLSRRDGA